MGLTGTRAVHWILAALLLVAWLALWAVRRRIPLWFFPAALCLAVLCFPAGVLAGRAETAAAGCTADNLCFSMREVDWWLNGALAMLACGALAAVTVAVELGRAASRYLSGRPGPG
ncbi:hypothetical protein D7193_21505 [Micromonospora costi]|uniref:Transmembrane protein n=1 Tax=Micromonospora costi TaxID=1530042 RepID=A0A3B0A2C2_9ACTN|nr:hypothetical protein D7193_21505 [Micromonospora costi]